MTAPTVQDKKPGNPNKRKGYFNQNQSPVNGQMASKLSELFKISQKNEQPRLHQRQQVSSRGLPPLRQESVDGVDHINFFANVQTELGALLSTENRLPFVFGPIDAEGNVQGENFESLKCLWAYYRTSCLVDGFRTVEDYKIRKLYSTINSFPKQESVFAVMVLGYYCKMLAYPDLANALVACNLPFDYYIVSNGQKTRPVVAKLMVNALYEVRRALSTNVQPRLESFLSIADQEKALNVLPAHRQSYIINILLGAETMRKSYYDTIKNWSKSDLSKLSIDLGMEKPSPVAEVDEPGYTGEVKKLKKEKKGDRSAALKEMDDVAATLNVPTTFAPGQLLEDDMKAVQNDDPDAPLIASIADRIKTEEPAPVTTEPSCVIPETVTQETVIPAEVSSDLEVKTVSEEAVLGEIQLGDVQHQSV